MVCHLGNWYKRIAPSSHSSYCLLAKIILHFHICLALAELMSTPVQAQEPICFRVNNLALGLSCSRGLMAGPAAIPKPSLLYNKE